MEKKFNVAELRSRIEPTRYFGELQYGDKVKLLFNYLEPNGFCDIPLTQFQEQIEDATKGGCGCVSDVKIYDRYIEATFDTTKTANVTEPTPYETNIIVWWRDGKPRKKKDMGQLVDDMTKAHTVLPIYGTIVPKK